jgi:glutathione S-transferase
LLIYTASLLGERQGAPVTTATPTLMEWRNRMTQRSAVRQLVSAMVTWLKAANRPVRQFMLATIERR